MGRNNYPFLDDANKSTTALPKRRFWLIAGLSPNILSCPLTNLLTPGSVQRGGGIFVEGWISCICVPSCISKSLQRGWRQAFVPVSKYPNLRSSGAIMALMAHKLTKLNNSKLILTAKRLRN